jgi:hypothetical protein
MYLCPHCGEELNQSTEICPHCGADLTLEGEPAAPSAPKPLRTVLIRWGMIVIVIAAGLWGFLWFVLPEQHGDPAARAEGGAIAALNDLRGALAAYSKATPDNSFPSSLEPLGDRARADAQLAQSVGYQLTYAPAAPAGDATIRGYALDARAGNFGYRSFFIDQTGVLRSTKENRGASNTDPPL